MKKALYIISFTLIISIGYCWYYFSQYHIEDNRTAIQSNLKEWNNRGAGSNKPDVLEVVRLDDTSSYIVLYKTPSENLGYAHLIKGWNGRYKIQHTGEGDNIADYQKIQTNNGVYGVIVGKNPNLKIDHIKADLYYGDFNIKSSVHSDEMFVRYKKIPSDIEEAFPAELTYYDKDGSVIELSDLEK
ncbi:hypothetical protein [Falsibacillus pallidus]|uniref:hypothetical protein n=1 Tax=Falsibacillus pallidus TaxID=493781 RepID=UPI003D9668AC